MLGASWLAKTAVKRQAAKTTFSSWTEELALPGLKAMVPTSLGFSNSSKPASKLGLAVGGGDRKLKQLTRKAQHIRPPTGHRLM